MTAEEREHIRQELVKAFLELKFCKETELTFLNGLKINSQLIPLLRRYKYEELQRDVEAMYRLYESVIKYKDDLIDILNKQLEDAAMQDARALSHHYDILSDLVDCFNCKAEKTHRQFKSEREALCKKFEKELCEIQSKHNQEMKEVEESGTAKTEEYEDEMSKLLEKYESLSNEIKEKMADEKQNIKAKMEPQKKRLMDLIMETHDNYLKVTTDKKRLYEELKEEDDKHADVIKSTVQTISLLTDNIKKLEKKVNDASNENAIRNALLGQQRDKLKKRKMEMLTALRISTQQGQEDLRTLAKHTEESLMYLQQLKKKAEEILRTRESIAKLELEEEQIYPFYKSHLIQEQCEIAQQEEVFNPSGFPDLEDTKEYHKLEMPFKLYSKVQLDNFFLQRELEELNAKNQQLRNVLRKHLDGIQVDRNILLNDALVGLIIAG